MFSHVRNLSLVQVVRSLVTSKHVSPSVLAAVAWSKHFSTNKNSRHMSKMVGPQSCLVSETKIMDRLSPFSSASYNPIYNERQDFMAMYPDLVREITEQAADDGSSISSKWFQRALEYNLPLGKKTRGLLTVFAYKKLSAENQLTPENIRLAQYLGWCSELAMSLMVDDIMDYSSTRRGQVCWHKVDDVGMIAINDSLMFDNAIFVILKKHFRHTDFYTDLIDLSHEMIFITLCGQSMDLLNATKDVADCTMNEYNLIVSKKTAYGSFYYPFAMAMYLAGFKDPEVFSKAKTILLEIGSFYQVQDDFIDCFGNAEKTGKIGTDIQDNKCSWLAMVCMQKANDAQKKIMAECYGQNDPEKIARVRQLYLELDLPRVFATYEEESYNAIKLKIERTSFGFPSDILIQILNIIYKRSS